MKTLKRETCCYDELWRYASLVPRSLSNFNLGGLTCTTKRPVIYSIIPWLRQLTLCVTGDRLGCWHCVTGDRLGSWHCVTGGLLTLSQVAVTDVCVPLSRLPEVITQTAEDLQDSSLQCQYHPSVHSHLSYNHVLIKCSFNPLCAIISYNLDVIWLHRVLDR